MADHTRTVFPDAALDHIAGAPNPWGRTRILTLGGSPQLPAALLDDGHDVFVVDRDPMAVAHAPLGSVAVVARAERLPFDPCQFDVVCAHQMLHRFEMPAVLSEAARALRPGGHLAVSYLQRDDSVPWVRRLTELVHTIDPNAMQGRTGADSVDNLLTSKYFPSTDVRSFRVWMPVTIDALVTQIGRTGRIGRLLDHERAAFLARVRALLADTVSGSGSTMRLPYELTVWRGHVDHDELTAPIQVNSDALVIEL